MKLDPKQVRFVAPFWPGLFRRRLRFAGRRNTLHLQETALVVEGELLRFHYFGFERLFARALCEWTTVTVPYSRIETVKYTRRWLARAVLVVPAILAAGVFGFGVWNEASKKGEVVAPLIVIGILVGLVWFLAVRVFAPGYVVTFRAKDGTRTTLQFRIRSKGVRREFDAALQRYRDAAAAHWPSARKGGE